MEGHPGRSRGVGHGARHGIHAAFGRIDPGDGVHVGCLLYTSDAADERSSVDLGGRRIIKKKKQRGKQRKERL